MRARPSALDPRNAYAFVERGVFEYSKKEYDKALIDFQRAIDLGSQSAVIYIARGMILLHKRDPNKAFAELKRAQEIDPRHPDVHAAIASMFMMQGKNDKALKVLDQAVALDPQCADSHGNRAVVFLAMGKYDEALDDLEEVLRLAPDSARQRERAWILATCPDAKIRNGEQAMLSASKACELTGWSEPHTLAILAAACSEAADFERRPQMAAEGPRSSAGEESSQTRVSRVTGSVQGEKAIPSSEILPGTRAPRPPSGTEVRRTPLRATASECSRGKESVYVVHPRPADYCSGDCGPNMHDAGASDLPDGASLQPFVRPKKSSSTQDRSFEYMQKTPDFSLNDGSSKTIPSGVGYICLLERSQGDQLLLAIRSQGLRGWAPASSLVPLNHAETFFSQQILANPRDPFAYLMRGMARFENDDLDRAFADVDEAIRLQPTYVPALVERAYLWQCRNRLDLALADANQAIKLDSQNSYAYVERGVFHFATKEYGKALRDFEHALRLGSRASVLHLCKGMIHLERGEGEPAIAEFNTAIGIDPRRLDAYTGLATVYLLRSDSRKALEVFDHAVLVDPAVPMPTRRGLCIFSLTARMTRRSKI